MIGSAITTLRGDNNYWPLEWVNPEDRDDVMATAGFVHPIGQWITVGGPLVANEAQKVDILVHPESTQAHLVMTHVDINTMGVKYYVPRRDFEKVSQLMERRRDVEGKSQPEQAADQGDASTGGEASVESPEVGVAQTAAGD